MNILYLCADLGIPIRGHKGASVHVRTMTDAFVRAGHTVTIMTPRPGPKDGPAPMANLVTIPGGETDEITSRDHQSQAHADRLYTAALELLAQRPFDGTQDRPFDGTQDKPSDVGQDRPFDFIYERYSLWSDIGARLACATGLPLVLEVNAPLCDEATRYRKLTDHQLAAQIEKTQFKAAAAIAVVSERLREYVLGRGARLDQVHVLSNGVDPMQFHPAARGGTIRDQYGLGERTVIGFVGRPRPWHDLNTLLRAVAQLHADDPRYHLLLVGQMPDDLPLQLAQMDLSQAATLTGPVPHATVPQHVAAMDVAVSSHLALTNFYFSPLKLFEYLACGVPTVAANVGQPSHIIQNGETGYLYPPGDAAALAERIRALVDNPSRARRVAWQGAVAVLENHTWDKNARTVTTWIQPTPPERKPASTMLPPLVNLPIMDRKLRQRLYRATRPDLVAPLLARYLPALWKKGPEQLEAVTNIEVLKYKPGRRCVLAYELEGRTRQRQQPTRHRVIGKVFRDERGLRLHRLQQQLRQNGFGPNAADGVHVPRSLAYVPEMRMQVQELAPGETLHELVTERDVKHLIPLAAVGLSKLHYTPPPMSLYEHGQAEMRSYLLADEVKNLKQFAATLTQVRPQSAPKVTHLHKTLRAWAAQLPPLPAPTPVHRDFYYSQILFDGPRLTLIDLDLFALGDPAIDVANFVAHLYFLGLESLGNWNALAREAKLFMATYARSYPVSETFRQRCAFYQAATFFRLMHVVARRPGWVHHFDTLYRHTADFLEAACV